MTNRRQSRLALRLPLFVILLGYGVLGALYVANTPLGGTPDEPAHLAVIQQIAAEGCCPVMQDHLEYEDHQPPLYYLLLTPIYQLSRSDVFALRYASMLLGAGAVIAAWAAARIAFPKAHWLAIGGAAFVAFLPQRLAMMAGVQNDALAESLAGALIVAALWHAHLDPYRKLHPLLLGLLLGLAFLTKLTLYPLAAVVLLAVMLRGLRDKVGLTGLIRASAWVIIPAVLIGSLLWIRNISIYGFPDFFAQARHDQLALGPEWNQPTRADWLELKGLAGWYSDLISTSFRSFWGQFGQMSVPLRERDYTLLMALSGVALLGALIGLALSIRQVARPQREAIILLAATFVLILGAYLYYNLKFVQFQGRYLYPALIPIAFAFVAGIATWIGLIANIARLSAARLNMALAAATGLFSVAMALFAVYGLYGVLIPFL